MRERPEDEERATPVEGPEKHVRTNTHEGADSAEGTRWSKRGKANEVAARTDRDITGEGTM